MKELDAQMQIWSTRLRDDLRISSPDSNMLASIIANEIRVLSSDAKMRVRQASKISLDTRLEELTAFQGYMDLMRNFPTPAAAAVRAQVVYQNYVCFVYLGDACFKVLKTELPSGSATRKICKFLTDNPVRAFRNAVAHANWQYLPDFSGIEFWARKGADPSDPMVRFEVNQNDLSFWQSLARCTAYAAYLTLNET